MVEATAVEPRGRISPDDMGIWSDDHIEPLARIARFIKQHGAVPAIQLAHAGRKASTSAPWKGHKVLSPDEGGWQPVGPSIAPFEGLATPSPLLGPQIKEIQNHFVDATRRALNAGFEVIELHGAHGYLAHSFYSPLSNNRTFSYGGSFENRIRFIMETAVRCENDPRSPAVLRATELHGLGGRRMDDRRFREAIRAAERTRVGSH